MSERHPLEDEKESVDSLDDQLQKLQDLFNSRVIKQRQDDVKDEDQMAKKKKKKIRYQEKPSLEKVAEITPDEVVPEEEEHTPDEVVPEEEEHTPDEVVPEEEEHTPDEAAPEEEEHTPDEVVPEEEESSVLSLVPDVEPEISPALDPEEGSKKRTLTEEQLKGVLAENNVLRHLLEKNKSLMESMLAQQEEADKEFKNFKQERKAQKTLIRDLLAENKLFRSVLFGQVQEKLLDFLSVFKQPEVIALLKEE